jgi:hypothetical protein
VHADCLHDSGGVISVLLVLQLLLVLLLLLLVGGTGRAARFRSLLQLQRHGVRHVVICAPLGVVIRYHMQQQTQMIDEFVKVTLSRRSNACS